MKSYFFQLILIITIPHKFSQRLLCGYYAAESEDEVVLTRFDGKKAYVEKRIQVGVWPEIEGPHGITISPEGLLASLNGMVHLMDIYINTRLALMKW